MGKSEIMAPAHSVAGKSWALVCSGALALTSQDKKRQGALFYMGTSLIPERGSSPPKYPMFVNTISLRVFCFVLF